MDVFAGFHGRVLAAVQQLKHDGVVPHEASIEGITLEPPKDASHGDLATNAAMVLAKAAGSRRVRSPSASCRCSLQTRSSKGRDRRTWLHQPDTRPCLLAERAPHGARAGRELRSERDRQGRSGERRVCVGQSDRADACRPTRGAVFGDALANLLAFAGSPSRANITSMTPAPRSMCSRARSTSATARRSARTSARSPRASIPATI